MKTNTETAMLSNEPLTSPLLAGNADSVSLTPLTEQKLEHISDYFSQSPKISLKKDSFVMDHV